MKKIICGLVLFCSVFFSIFGNNTLRKDKIGNSQEAYRNALYSFDIKEYGKSLKLAEDAMVYRKQQIEYENKVLKESLSSRAVHSAGDNIKDILKILKSRKENEVINIINNYLKKKGEDYFNNSMDNLLNYMESLKVFPEAQKLIGDIYKLEGEYTIAEEYYKMALDNSSVLDIPDEKYEILYMLAEISYFEKNYDSYEIRLLNILTEDKNYKDDALRRAVLHTISGNNKRAFEKFFSLYRANSYNSINAYIQLANYYYDIEEYERALEFSALGVITSFTKINESLKSRNTEYKPTSLNIFLQECAFYDDIVKWGNDKLVWNCFTLLAKSAIKNGYEGFARELLISLVKYLPEEYWRKDAVLVLENLN